MAGHRKASWWRRRRRSRRAGQVVRTLMALPLDLRLLALVVLRGAGR